MATSVLDVDGRFELGTAVRIDNVTSFGDPGGGDLYPLEVEVRVAVDETSLAVVGAFEPAVGRTFAIAPEDPHFVFNTSAYFPDDASEVFDSSSAILVEHIGDGDLLVDGTMT